MKTRFYYRSPKGNLLSLIRDWLLKRIKKEENSQGK